jgi:hypothetical protein
MGRTKQTPVRKNSLARRIAAGKIAAAKRKYSSRQVKLAHENFYSGKIGNPRQRYRFLKQKRYDRQSVINPTFSDTTQPVIAVLGKARKGSKRNPITII